MSDEPDVTQYAPPCPGCGYQCGCCCQCSCQTLCPTHSNGACDCFNDCHGGHEPWDCHHWHTRWEWSKAKRARLWVTL